MESDKVLYSSPIGIIKVLAVGGNITYLNFEKDGGLPDIYTENKVLLDCVKQLDEYFGGRLRNFNLSLKAEGTEFRKKVWDALIKIPYGETRSYKDIAAAVGNEKAVRAVGGANHHNPISIIIPCHRVLGADGSLTGYGGELWRKEWLLEHEKINLQEV